MADKEDGGYYAIKGFLFQYDKSILEILQNHCKTIALEQIQDINYEKYVLQVKHKETQNFSNSKIKEPIIELLELYKNDLELNFCLYAYFKDKEKQIYVFKTIKELKKVIQYRDLTKNKEILDKYDDELLLRFIQHFKLVFADDFEKQFKDVISMIQDNFHISKEESYVVHSLIRDYLMNVVAQKSIDNRLVSFAEIEKHINECKQVTFNSMYIEIIGKEQYLKAIRKKFFTEKSANINKYERLLLIECNEYENRAVIRKIIELVGNKYYRKNKSPAPYIVFRNLNKDDLNLVKQGLIDDSVRWTDGTCFDGDKFRIEKVEKNKDVVIKIISDANLDELLDFVEFKEVYDLYTNNKTVLKTSTSIINSIVISGCDDFIELIR